MRKAKHTCQHREQPAMTYLQRYADAERRILSGEQQRKCDACGFYVWEEFWNEKADDQGRRTQ